MAKPAAQTRMMSVTREDWTELRITKELASSPIFEGQCRSNFGVTPYKEVGE